MSEFEKMTIKSGVRDYTVQETTNWMEALNATLEPGDALFMDHGIRTQWHGELNEMCETRGVTLVSVVPESAKTLTYTGRLVTALSGAQFSRSSRIFVVGGASVMDVSGFVASIYMRGVEWIYFPSTLLSQADACIGGKTSLNLGTTKNLIGTFWPPSSVVIDRSFLLTLPYQHQLSGIGEMLHFFMVHGGSGYYWAKEYMDEMLNSCASFAHPELVEAAQQTLWIKRLYIETDERDQGVRRHLNFGHTFAHGIEAVTPSTPHGLAVTKGIEIACLMSRDLGHLDGPLCNEMTTLARRVLDANSEPIQVKKVNAMALAMSRDKKRGADKGYINVILTHGPGEMFEMALKAITVRDFLGAFGDLTEAS